MFPEAISTLEKAKSHHSGNATIWASLGEVYAQAGMREKAGEVIAELETRSNLRYVSAFHFALVHAGLEQNDEAFQWLERAYEERSPYLAVLLPVDPRLENLRSDSRFDKFIDRIVGRRKS